MRRPHFGTFNDWSAGAGNYDARAAADMWKSFKPGKGVGSASLFGMARDHGWQDNNASMDVNFDALLSRAKAHAKPVEPPRRPSPNASAETVWNRLQPATNQHAYIAAKVLLASRLLICA